MLNQFEMPKKGEEIAVLETNHGKLKFRLFEDIAPKAVNNFKELIKSGYYDGIIFHRVINDFMIQGGDPTGTGMGGESIYKKPFEDEFNINYRNFKGALSMANAGVNTNGSQFFIVQKGPVEADVIEQMREAGEEKGYPKDIVDAYEKIGGAYWLDGKHTVFGQIIEGIDIVNEIAGVEINENDKPINDVVIERAVLENY